MSDMVAGVWVGISTRMHARSLSTVYRGLGPRLTHLGLYVVLVVAQGRDLRCEEGSGSVDFMYAGSRLVGLRHLCFSDAN